MAAPGCSPSVLWQLVLVAGMVSPGWALYFHLGETERKCFIEEIPDETMVIGNYWMQLFDKQLEEYLPTTGLGMFVEVKDPYEKVLLSRQYGSEDRFTFISHTPGKHRICLQSNSTVFPLFAGSMLRVHLDSQHTNNSAGIAFKLKLNRMLLCVRQLLKQIKQIQEEQNNRQWREFLFRETSRNTNECIFWWSIVQILILVAIGVWQMKHLRSFYVLGVDSSLLPLGDSQGSTMLTSYYVQVSPEEHRKESSVWNQLFPFLKDWECHINFKNHGTGKKNPQEDGFILWHTLQHLTGDNHDIISVKLFQLMVDHPPEEENIDWTKIEPSVSLLKSPKDNVDDPTHAIPIDPVGNVHSGPLMG